MNRIYRQLFNGRLGCWIAVAETCTTSGKGRGGRRRLVTGSIVAAISLLASSSTWADGAGGTGVAANTNHYPGGAGTGVGSIGNGGNGGAASAGDNGNAGVRADGSSVSGGTAGPLSTGNNVPVNGTDGATAQTTNSSFTITAGQKVVGGGGGGGGFSFPSVDSGTANGGAGGNGLLVSGAMAQVTNLGSIIGGGGGGGGAAVALNGASSSVNGGNGGVAVSLIGIGAALSNSGVIAGGGGGGGGFSSAFTGFYGTANGGVGGIGVQMTDGQTLVNTGSILGGNGGNRGNSIPTLLSSGAGAAGVSLTGTGSKITNAGSISGGQAGDGGARANAVTIIGDSNTLELQSGYGFVGNVIATGNSNALILGGASNAAFDLGSIATTLPSSYSGVAAYYGFASYTKTDASTWTLTGTTTSAAPWSVTGGTLAVNGSMANAAVSVSSSGILAGSGTVGAVSIGTGGTLAASTLGSGLTINGDLSFDAGATYNVAVNTAGLSGITTVQGNVNIANGTTLTLAGVAGTYTTGTTYQVLSYTGTETGSFSTVNTNLAYVTPSVTYANNAISVLFNVSPSFVASGFSQVANTNNQRSVAGALDSIYAAGGNALTGVLLTASVSEAQRVLANASGDSVLGLKQVASNQFRSAQDAIGERLSAVDMAAASGMNAGDSDDPWITVRYGYQHQSGDAGSGASGFNNRSASVSVGHDHAINENWLLGAALSVNNNNISYETSSASGRSDGLQVALYARYRPTQSPFFMKGIASYGKSQNTLSRQLTLGALTGSTNGNFDVNGGALYGEIGMTLPLANLSVEPYFGMSVARQHQQGFSESTVSGSNAFALSYAGQTSTEGATVIGTRVQRTVDIGGNALTWQADVAWRHRIGASNQTATAAFVSASNNDFAIQSSAQTRDEAILRVGASYAFNDRVAAYAQTSASVGNGTHTYAGTVSVRWLW